MIYEIRFSAAATARYRAAVASRRQIRYGVRMLAARAALRARSLRSRTATGALADSFGLADAVAIRWVRDRESGFFLIRAGRELIACDVLPERRIVLVLTIVGRHELAARLGLPTSASPYSFAHTVFSSR